MTETVDAIRPFLLWPMGYREDEIGRMAPGDIFAAFSAFVDEQERQERRIAWALSWLVTAIARKKIRPEQILGRRHRRRRDGSLRERDVTAMTRDRQKSPDDATGLFSELEADLRG